MKKIILLCSLIILVNGVACQKKGDDAPPPISCAPGTLYSSFWARCVSQAGCAPGLGIHPEQTGMCMNISTGVLVSAAQCGVGLYLTARGCLQQGLCPQGRAQSGEVCMEIISASSFNQQNFSQSGYNQQNFNQPGYNQQQYYNNPYYYRGW